MVDYKKMVESNTILRCIVGSTLYGTNLADSDVDQMGVCVESLEAVAGFREFEQDISQTIDPTTQKIVAETKIYGLKKFLRLALQGNPDVTPLFFVPPSHQKVSHAVGRQLQELAPHIVSRLAGARFLGYMESQRQRMIGERGQKRTNRPELVALYGYDTKYAMQLLRLGLNGVELISTGKITFPMVEGERDYLVGVRTGKFTINDVLQRAGELERELKDLIGVSPLPETPDRDLVEEWMIERYWQFWKVERFMSDRSTSTEVH